jgi:putative thioredoxin
MTQAASAYIRDVDDASFEEQVIRLSHSVPVVVDFWAEWCGPCRMLGPVLEKLAERDAGKWVLAKVNVDDNPESASRYRVQGIPAVKAFRDGKIVDQFEGVIPERYLSEWLGRLLPTEADALVKSAAEKASTDKPAARAELENALSLEPDRADVRILLAGLLADTGENARARELLEAVPPGGEEGDRAEAVRAVIDFREAAASGDGPYETACRDAAEGRYQPALEAFLSLIEADRDRWLDKCRAACVRVFLLAGPASDLSNEYRRKLSQLLY